VVQPGLPGEYPEMEDAYLKGITCHKIKKSGLTIHEKTGFPYAGKPVFSLS